MSAPATRPQPWWTRPRLVLPLAAGLALLSALFAPSRSGPRDGDARLTTRSAGPLGARLLFDLTSRLGWKPERQLHPGFTGDSATIFAVLDPVVAVRATEAHALLEHVRAGGGALVVLGPTTRPLLDSLHLRIGTAGSRMRWIEPDSTACAGRTLPAALSLWFGSPPRMRSFDWRRTPPPDLIHFVETDRQRAESPELRNGVTVLGFGLGRGRIVVAADPDVYRTDAMRDCETGLDVAAVRALEFLRAGDGFARGRIVFDEYHQAFGAHPGTVSSVMLYLRDAPSGRLLAQLAMAGLLLLFALGPRLVAPRDEPRLERRSPLEHVDALARAYAQVGATRTVAQRLLRGLRRRVARSGLTRATSPDRALDDLAWLALVAAKHPALAPDLALLQRAQSSALSDRELPALGPALHRIETTLTRPT